ncbi:MAG TPA: pilus assembly protein [Verrucomicrobiae bacterium]|nr:pilus assembly protein [Verrucomicrobiae bacterium]
MHRARRAEYSAVLPGHALTTLHYLIEKYSGTTATNDTIDGLLADFVIHPIGKPEFIRARQLLLKDFEDATVAAIVEATGSQYIVTRNVQDFVGAPVPAITPIEFLEKLADAESGLSV